jgi:hypothetical protein
MSRHSSAVPHPNPAPALTSAGGTCPCVATSTPRVPLVSSTLHKHAGDAHTPPGVCDASAPPSVHDATTAGSVTDATLCASACDATMPISKTTWQVLGDPWQSVGPGLPGMRDLLG